MRNKLGHFIKGHKTPEKWIEATRKANIGRPAWNKGKRMSSAWRERCRQKGLNMPDFVKNKISKSVKKLWKNPDYKNIMRNKLRKNLSGRIVNFYGYILIYNPEHPYAKNHGSSYVPEHRLIMEKCLGRYLGKNERVHHRNHNPSDNRAINLKLFSNHSKHMKYHFPKGSKFGINSH